MSIDTDILAEDNARLRDENSGLRNRVPLLERRNRWDRFLLVLMGVVTFIGMGFGRLYWLHEGSQMACPEVLKVAPVSTVPKGCKDTVIPFRDRVECPHSEQTGKYLYRTSESDLFVCTCSRTDVRTDAGSL